MFRVRGSRTSNREHRAANVEQRTTNVEQRTELEHEPRSENIEA